MILIVEDEPELCEMIVETFEEEGMKAEGVLNAEEAVQKVLHGSYQAVLTDIRLTGMDGLTMIQTLREKFRGPSLPLFFVMTGFSEYTEAEIKSFGIERLFQKPSDIPDIPELVSDRIRARMG